VIVDIAKYQDALPDLVAAVRAEFAHGHRLSRSTLERISCDHCTEPGCTLGPARCEAHHIWHWEHGGPTNLDNLRSLCCTHHRTRHLHDAQARAG
jgi:hypothetical protein